MGSALLRHRSVGEYQEKQGSHKGRIERLWKERGEQGVGVARVGALNIVNGDEDDPVDDTRAEHRSSFYSRAVRNKALGHRADQIADDNETEDIVAQRRIGGHLLEYSSQKPRKHGSLFAFSDRKVDHEHDAPASLSARIDEYGYALPGVFTSILPSLP